MVCKISIYKPLKMLKVPWRNPGKVLNFFICQGVRTLTKPSPSELNRHFSLSCGQTHTQETMWIKACSLLQEEQYAKWMAACRLASKGKTMADSSYDSEVQSIQAFLSMQHPAPAPVIDANRIDFQPEDFVAPRFLKKLKTKQV